MTEEEARLIIEDQQRPFIKDQHHFLDELKADDLDMRDVYYVMPRATLRKGNPWYDEEFDNYRWALEGTTIDGLKVRFVLGLQRNRPIIGITAMKRD